MNQIAYVSKIENDIAHLEVRRSSACGDKCSSCGGSCDIPVTRVRMKNTLKAEQGDLVEVKMETKFVLKSAFIVYIIPLVLMISGIIIGISIFESIGIGNPEAMGLLAGVILLAVSYFILRSIDKKIKNGNKIKFELVKIIQ